MHCVKNFYTVFQLQIIILQIIIYDNLLSFTIILKVISTMIYNQWTMQNVLHEHNFQNL